MPRFSVVISVFNKEKYIHNTIMSVLEQSIQDFEIILVNDGSTDTSQKVIENIADKRIKLYHTQNKGAAAARNFGINKASGTYIALLDGDDFWHPFFLKEIDTLITLFPEESVFATAIELKTKNYTYPAKYSIPHQKHQVLNYFEGSLLKTLLSSSSTVLKKEVFNKIGYYDETIYSGEDTDMWIRIGLVYNIAFSNKIAVTYINTANSLSNKFTLIKNRINFNKFEACEQQNTHLKKFLDLNRWSLAILSKQHNDLDNYKYFKANLDLKNLNWKQKLLLKLPSSILKVLIKIKSALIKKKIVLSVFE